MKKVIAYAVCLLFSVMAFPQVTEKSLVKEGVGFFLGSKGHVKDPHKAFDCFMEAARLNSAEAKAALGYMYETGIGAEKDLLKAYEWYLQAADQDYAGAQYRLGQMYAKGIGVEMDIEKALLWYNNALMNGKAEAAVGISAQETIIFQSTKRLALVIGNEKYSKNKIDYAGTDAKDVTEKLKSLGFDVTVKTNLNLRDMDQTIDEFCEKAADYDVVMFFYIGNAVQVDGVNYLIPVKDKVDPKAIKYDCINMERFINKLDYSNANIKIIVLNACRDNSLMGNDPSRKGLARMTSMGYAIMLSAQAGQTEGDFRQGSNSMFTKMFLDELAEPNIPLYQFLKNVQTRVSRATGNAQIPSISDDLIDNFYFIYYPQSRIRSLVNDNGPYNDNDIIEELSQMTENRTR